MTESQPSPAPGGDEVKDANGDEQYQETELFEDTLVLNIPFTETEVEKLDLNTEVVEDSEPVENMTTGTTFGHEAEVVLDSEDEEMNNTGEVTVAKGFLEDETSPVVIIPSMRFQKRWPKLTCEQPDSTATTSGKSAIGDKGASIHGESFDDNNHLYLPARLNHTHSPEPGDSTQAALGFVDQYLSSNNVHMFQGIQYRKITREKSPHVLSVRGPLSLAKKIKSRTQNEDKEPFKWDDINQNDKEAGIFCKKVEESPNFRRHRQTYKRRRQKKGSHLQNQGNCITRCDENLVQVPRLATENNNSLKELDVESCATRENVNIYSSVAHKEDMSDIGLDTQIAAEAMDSLVYLFPPGFHSNDVYQPENAFDGSLSDLKQAHQKNSSCKENPGLHSIALKSKKSNLSSCTDVESCATRENVNIYSSVARTEDMSGIGLDTQIAAEAMDALAYLSPPGSLSDLKQAHQKNSSGTDVESCATRENVNIYSSVARTKDMSFIGLDTQIAAEAMDALAYLSPPGSHFNDAHQPENAIDGSLSDLKQTHQKNSSCRENPGLHSIGLKPNKRNVPSCRFSKGTSSSSCKRTSNQESNPVSGKMKKIMESKSAIEGQFKNNTISSICSEQVSHEEVCLPGKPTSFQPAAKEPKNWNKSRWTRIKDQPSHHTETDNNVEEKGIIRHKRKGNCLVEEPVKLDVKTKRLNLPTNSCGVARKTRLNHQVQVSPQLSATSSFSRADSWAYPKGPRGKRKRANASRVLCIDVKESNVYSTRSLEGQDDVHKLCFPHTHPPCNASCIDNGRCLLQGNSVRPVSAGDAIKFENLHDMHPLLLAHVEISSNKSVAQSSSEISATVASSEGLKFSNASHTYNEHHNNPCEKNLPKASLLKELIRLGVPKSTSDMMSKDVRHRRDMKHVRVLFSQHLDGSVIKQQKKILARLNVSIVSSSMEATHFIADKFTRTKNMLETMALGKLVVTHFWLESCGQANCFIDEKSYILRDMKKEKEIGFSMPVSLARARQKPLLKGKRVYITPHIKPDKEVVASLVTAVHGQLVDENQICADNNDNMFDDLLILSCEEDYPICRHFLKRGAAVCSSELVLNGIVIQKLELERHKLFVNQVTRNNPSNENRFGKVYRRRLRPLS